MSEKYNWLERKTPRSIEQLKLWNENPRLNPEERHISLADFTEDLIADENEKKHFFELLKSIAEEYIPADPIIVWKDENSHKFYVAEGNRRILALKLLNDPSKAPKSIRAYVRNLAKERKTLDKIKVNVAPSFDEAEWYINQRNSVSTLQRPWTRLQQQRWIETMYKKYGGNVEVLLTKVSMSQSELENAIRNLRLLDLIKTPEVKNKLTEQQYKEASSYRFPVTILERFFSNKVVKDRWGISFDGVEVNLKNKSGFLNAFAELIKNIVSKEPVVQIDTRTITTNLDAILGKLPEIDLSQNEPYCAGKQAGDFVNAKGDKPDKESKSKEKEVLKGDPNRPYLILSTYTLHTTDYRLQGIFNELKKLSVGRYTNAVAASIRIFLDLAVLNWLQTEGLISELERVKQKSLIEITLNHRIEFIAGKLSAKDKNASSILTKLMNKGNEFSLDVLNGYQHSKNTAFLDKLFINRFWDFLFPLFEVLLEIKEE